MIRKKVKINPIDFNIYLNSIKLLLNKYKINFRTDYYKDITKIICILNKYLFIVDLDFDGNVYTEISNFQQNNELNDKNLEKLKIYSNYLDKCEFLLKEILKIRKNLYYDK